MESSTTEVLYAYFFSPTNTSSLSKNEFITEDYCLMLRHLPSVSAWLSLCRYIRYIHSVCIHICTYFLIHTHSYPQNCNFFFLIFFYFYTSFIYWWFFLKDSDTEILVFMSVQQKRVSGESEHLWIWGK